MFIWGINRGGGGEGEQGGGTSSPMCNDRSPESQHNVGDTIIYNAQRQTVFNLGKFKLDHFHSISDENKTLSNISPFT